MRLPKDSQLSVEQRVVCLAPCEGTVLVTGPPGSGKTVVGLFRARELEAGETTFSFLVFNRVLRKYADHGATFDSWIPRWWRNCTGTDFPRSRPIGQSRYSPLDFKGARELVKNSYKDQVRSRGHWSHLILDEAQDFAPEAHQFLSYICSNVFVHLEEDERPSLLILADENQQLTETGSSISDIQGAHMTDPDEEYLLSRNYRNSLEIAKVAGYFYVGLPTGIPELPERRGEKPKLIRTTGLDAAVDRMVKYLRIHPDHDVGVLVKYDKTRKKIFNKLLHRLRDTDVLVQTYATRDAKDHPAEKLEFDRGGSATVLCFASGKGLEFDAVFLPELQTVPIDSENLDLAKMNLYVMTSRARMALFLMISDPTGRADIWRLLPSDPELLDIES